jgi:3-isopropylmalate dehydrogenase
MSKSNLQLNGSYRSASSDLWSDSIFADPVRNRSLPASLVVGVLEGEGIGPDVVYIALRILRALESTSHRRFEVSFGGPIGTEAESRCGEPLSDEVVEFCRSVFSRRGAILTGPGGGRFVYDLRKRFDLFCKLSPLKVSNELIDAAHIKPEYIRNVDILLVRENVAGVYQGWWNEISTLGEGRKAEQSFFYTEKQVRRVLEVAARIARQRRGHMTIVLKEGGIPAVSKLWRDCTIEIASEAGVEYSLFNVDHAAYHLIQYPQELDVIVASNLFGDILADLGSALLGSRGVSFSGNFSSNGAAVYQTNHGAAYDLAGKNRANPVGQIFSLAMLLRESFGLVQEASLIEDAVAEVWSQGWRTTDVAETGCCVVGTEEMGELITKALIRLCSQADQTAAK